MILINIRVTKYTTIFNYTMIGMNTWQYPGLMLTCLFISTTWLNHISIWDRLPKVFGGLCLVITILQPFLLNGENTGLEAYGEILKMAIVPYLITGFTLIIPYPSFAMQTARKYVTNISKDLKEIISTLHKGFNSLDFIDLHCVEVNQLLYRCEQNLAELQRLQSFIEFEVIIFKTCRDFPVKIKQFILQVKRMVCKFAGLLDMAIIILNNDTHRQFLEYLYPSMCEINTEFEIMLQLIEEYIINIPAIKWYNLFCSSNSELLPRSMFTSLPTMVLPFAIPGNRQSLSPSSSLHLSPSLPSLSLSTSSLPIKDSLLTRYHTSLQKTLEAKNSLLAAYQTARTQVVFTRLWATNPSPTGPNPSRNGDSARRRGRAIVTKGEGKGDDRGIILEDEEDESDIESVCSPLLPSQGSRGDEGNIDTQNRQSRGLVRSDYSIEEEKRVHWEENSVLQWKNVAPRGAYLHRFIILIEPFRDLEKIFTIKEVRINLLPTVQY